MKDSAQVMIEMKIAGIAIDPFSNSPVVILKDADEVRTIPVWIGFLEASSIASVLSGVVMARPMTHDLLKNVIEMFGGRVTRADICELRDNTFYATMYIEVSKGNVLALDSRPSDAIAIALRFKAPIFVAKNVLDAVTRPAEKEGEASGEKSDEEKLKEFLDNINPEDFKKFST